MTASGIDVNAWVLVGALSAGWSIWALAYALERRLRIRAQADLREARRQLAFAKQLARDEARAEALRHRWLKAPEVRA